MGAKLTLVVGSEKLADCDTPGGKRVCRGHNALADENTPWMVASNRRDNSVPFQKLMQKKLKVCKQ